MTKLPETTDLPRADEGYEPARVEEAFAAFGDRVRELEAVAAELRDEVRALRAERSVAAAPQYAADERWPSDFVGEASPEWVASVPPPVVRGVTVPRLAVEAVFLLAVAVLAGLADLSAPWIVGVMVAAWTLVALVEWAAAAKRARWRLDEIPPPAGGAAAETTGPWDMPVVEATVVAGPDAESKTIVAKLPEPEEPSAEEQEPPEETAPEEPKRRFARLRRRRAVEAAPDPWET